MKNNIFAILLIYLITFIAYGYTETVNPDTNLKSATKMFSGIKSLLPTVKQVSSSSLNVENISGHYCTLGPSMKERRGGALSGSELYLFPDNTYIYLKWADILPLTIYEKGQWDINNSFIILHSDGSVHQKDLPRDHEYLPLIIQSGTKDNIFIMGTEKEYSYFIKEAKNDPAFMLLLCGLEKEKTISHNETKSIREKLMKESWRPEFFKE